jgi:ketopantoate reductase
LERCKSRRTWLAGGVDSTYGVSEPRNFTVSSKYVVTKLDREYGRPMEFEVILGDPIKRAAELGIQVPIMTTVYKLLKLARWKAENDFEV